MINNRAENRAENKVKILKVLERIKEGRGFLFLREISELTGISSSYLPRLIDEMEKEGLVASQKVESGQKGARRNVFLRGTTWEQLKLKLIISGRLPDEELSDLLGMTVSKIKTEKIFFELNQNRL